MPAQVGMTTRQDLQKSGATESDGVAFTYLSHLVIPSKNTLITHSALLGDQCLILPPKSHMVAREIKPSIQEPASSQTNIAANTRHPTTLQFFYAHSSILNQCRELLIHRTGSRLCCGEVPSLIAVLSSTLQQQKYDTRASTTIAEITK